MNAERWQRVKAILADALDAPAASRDALIDAACGSDDELRREVVLLIAADAAQDLIAPPGSLIPGLRELAERESSNAFSSSDSRSTMVGKKIAGFTILRLIGIGGMGTVYEARQGYPSRTVALKVMRWGVTSQAALRRFEFEAQVLARMQHPGIAQVYEAGVERIEGVGVPYFAMELVPNAVGLTEYANSRNLNVRQRVELFVRVCEAVQHGHLRGVVHRDLKPSNILVRENDGEPMPKIIDFGVARATDADVAATTIMTDARQLVGTLSYMSPEQCGVVGPNSDLVGADIDARSDVYSLGIVLYELLTRSMPYDLTGSRAMNAPAIIREQSPVPPGVRAPTVKGDLEIVVLKALEKAPSRRYQSAQDLAEDLRRYLNGDAILARPPGTAYRTRVFVRRNKLLVGSAAAITFAVVAGLVVAAALYRQAAEYRTAADEARAAAINAQETATSMAEAAGSSAKRAQRAAKFLASTLASVNNNSATFSPDAPGWDQRFYPLLASETQRQRIAVKPGHTPSAVDVLNAAIAELNTEFADEPLLRADLAMALQKGLAGTTEPPDRRKQLLEHAVDLRKTNTGDENADTIEALMQLGAFHASFNNWREAEPLFVEVMHAAPAVYGPLSSWERDAGRRLTGVLLVTGAQPSYAVKLQTDMFQRCVEHFGREDPATLVEEAMLCVTLTETGDVQLALKHGRHAFHGLLQTLGRSHSATGDAAASIGILLWRHSLRGNEAEVSAMLKLAAEAQDAQFGSSTEYSRWHWRRYLTLKIALGDYEEAAIVSKRELASIQRAEDPSSLTVAFHMRAVARALTLAGGSLEEANALAQDADGRMPPGDIRDALDAAITRGVLALARGNVGLAESLAAQSWRDACGQRSGSDTSPDWVVDPWTTSAIQALSARCWAIQGCPEEATICFDEALRLADLHNSPEAAPRIVLLRRGVRLFDEIGDSVRASIWRTKLREVAMEEGEYGHGPSTCP